MNTHIISKDVSCWADSYYVCILIKHTERDWTVVFAYNKKNTAVKHSFNVTIYSAYHAYIYCSGFVDIFTNSESDCQIK